MKSTTNKILATVGLVMLTASFLTADLSAQSGSNKQNGSRMGRLGKSSRSVGKSLGNRNLRSDKSQLGANRGW